MGGRGDAERSLRVFERIKSKSLLNVAYVLYTDKMMLSSSVAK